MAINITGSDPNQPVWPINCPVISGGSGMTHPNGYTVVGGNYPSVLNSASDSSYIWEHQADAYFRIATQGLALPSGARVSSCYGWVRVKRHPSNAKYPNFLVGVGDHSAPGGINEDNVPKETWHVPSTSAFGTYYSTSTTMNRQGQQLTQADFNAGMYLVMGGNDTYKNDTLTTGWYISQGGLKVTYDLPPSASITSPAAGTTFQTTASPIITWDYFDDFQTQDSYQVTVLDNSGNLVYDSGKVSSADTFHALTANLPNGTYTAYVMVWQAWSVTTVPFPAQVAAQVSFTINLLSLSTPRLTVVPNTPAGIVPANCYGRAICYPDINLVSYNASTFENNTLEWANLVNCTVRPDKSTFRDGTQSCRVALTSSTAQLFQSTRLVEVDVNPTTTNQYKAQVYVNPGVTTGAKCRLTLNFYDSNNTLLGATSGSLVTMTANQYNQVTVTSASNPAVSGAVYISAQINFTVAASGNVFNIDSFGIWCLGGTTVLPTWSRGGFFESTPNLLQYADSTFESGNTSWAASGFVSASGIVTIAAAPTGVGGLDGGNALSLQSMATGGQFVQAALGGTNGYLPCTPGHSVFMGLASVCVGASGAPVTYGFQFYDSGLNQLGGLYQAGAFTNASGAWSPSGVNSGFYSATSGAATVPPSAAYMSPYISVKTVGTTDIHYFDAIAVYDSANYPGQVFLRGQLPNTDSEPQLVIQYSNDGGVTFQDLQTFDTSPNQEYFEADDYNVPSSGSHAYRAYLYETENGIYMQSPYASGGSFGATVSHVYMHADASPSGTFYPFAWDGGGRAENDDLLPAMIDVDGLAYPFAQFPEESNSSIDVNLHLDNAADIAAWQVLRSYKGQIVFRDQRGRCARGVLTSVKTTDAVYGVAQDVSFTLVLTGDQP